MKENKENHNKLTLAMCSVTCFSFITYRKAFLHFFYTTFRSSLFVVVRMCMCYYKINIC